MSGAGHHRRNAFRQGREIYHIRGWATSGTSHPGNTFYKTLYLQDDTGGVALVPFTKKEKEKDIEVGTPIEVVGRKEIRGGNVVLKIIDYEVQDEPLYNYTPKTTPNEDAMDYDTNGGRLMQVEGKVTKVTYTDEQKSRFPYHPEGRRRRLRGNSDRGRHCVRRGLGERSCFSGEEGPHRAGNRHSPSGQRRHAGSPGAQLRRGGLRAARPGFSGFPQESPHRRFDLDRRPG